MKLQNIHALHDTAYKQFNNLLNTDITTLDFHAYCFLEISPVKPELMVAKDASNTISL